MKIGIVGGRGRMGRWFRDFFERQGHEVVVAGRSAPFPSDIAKRVDVLILSVPLWEMEGVIKKVGPVMPEEALMMDFGSVKVLPAKWMLDLSHCEVIGAHPLFGPDHRVHEGLSICLCPVRTKRWLKVMEDVFRKGGLKVVVASAEEHDRNMALIQAVHHLSNLAVGSLLKDMDVPEEFFTPSFKARLKLIRKVLSGDLRMYRAMIDMNPFFRDVFNDYLNKLNKLSEKESFDKEFLYTSASVHRSKRSRRLAYLGPEGTFSHIAARALASEGFDLLGTGSITEAFEAAEKGKADCALVPVENSIEGPVGETHDLLMETSLKVQLEVELRISYVLASRSGDLCALKRVYSHPQAFAQCRGWFRENLSGVELVPCASTGQAASMASRDVGSGALVAKEAADLYGLRVIKEKLEDFPLNATRFFVLGYENPFPDLVPVKASLSFLIPHIPGALYRALAPFAEAGLNLCRITSRPLKRFKWEYAFFVDVEMDGCAEFEQALNGLKQAASLVKVLGIYPVINLEQF